MSKTANTLPNGRISAEGWEQASLGDIANIGAGNPAPQGEQFFKDGIYPFVRVQDMGRLGENKHIINTADRINQFAIEKMKLFPKGTVLFTKSGASSLLNQRAILKTDMYVVSHIATAIPFNGILSEYLYYWLKIIDFNHIAHATTLPSIPLSKVFGIQISLASPEEQKQIVNIIEEIFSDLDNAIENLQKAREQLKVYRQAVLNYAFEGKLTNDFENWRKTTLGEIISISSGNGLTKAKRNDDGKYLVYGGNGIAGNHSEYLFEEEKLIIGRVGAQCGNAHITKPYSWVTDNAFVVTFNENEFDIHYLYYLAISLNLNKYSSSTAQPVISQGKVYPIEIAVPKTIKEQQAIVSEIASRLSVCDKLEESINDNLQKAKALRQSVLKQAFEGNLTEKWRKNHRDLISGENSAEALLKKIKVEKEALTIKSKGRNKND